ncbi:MAG TPA: hypothetical protein VFB38_25160 [Chthonomonadaceae bacterium]|nr:hypothetical protein [Chthonomonadaceae bacterium]
MEEERAEIRWPPRVRKDRLRRLYESDARGLLDEELVEDVGYALYLRCQAILTIAEARKGRVKCPRCAHDGKVSIILRKGGRDEVLQCPECAWSLTWHEYQKSYKRRQLNPGGAVEIFQAFVQRFERARSPREKMLAIDRVIHEFHYYNQAPSRATGVNLIEGRLTDVLAFLDTLTYGEGSTPGTKVTQQEWRSKLKTTIWPGILSARYRDGD